MQAVGGGQTLGSVVAPAHVRGEVTPCGFGLPKRTSTLTVGHTGGQGGRLHAQDDN